MSRIMKKKRGWAFLMALAMLLTSCLALAPLQAKALDLEESECKASMFSRFNELYTLDLTEGKTQIAKKDQEALGNCLAALYWWYSNCLELHNKSWIQSYANVNGTFQMDENDNYVRNQLKESQVYEYSLYLDVDNQTNENGKRWDLFYDIADHTITVLNTSSLTENATLTVTPHMAYAVSNPDLFPSKKVKNVYPCFGSVLVKIKESSGTDLADLKKQLKVTVPTVTYNGKEQTPKPTVQITGDNAKTLKEGVDYRVSYDQNLHAGTGIAMILGMGDYTGAIRTTFTIQPKKVTPKFKVAIDSYSKKKSLNPGTYELTSLIVDGRQLNLSNTPAGFKDQELYDVVWSTDSFNYTKALKDPRLCYGPFTCTVTLKGDYTGSKTVTYQSRPDGTSLTKLTRQAKGFTASWKEMTKDKCLYNVDTGKNVYANLNGYQLQYSKDKTFKTGVKKVTIKKTNITSTTIKKLKKNQTYYVRVRTYLKGVDGKKIPSAWSNVKKVKTK